MVSEPAAWPATANGSFSFHSFSCSSRPLLLQLAWKLSAMAGTFKSKWIFVSCIFSADSVSVAQSTSHSREP